MYYKLKGKDTEQGTMPQAKKELPCLPYGTDNIFFLLFYNYIYIYLSIKHNLLQFLKMLQELYIYRFQYLLNFSMALKEPNLNEPDADNFAITYI